MKQTQLFRACTIAIMDRPCPTVTCSEVAEPVSAVQVALVVILAIILIYYIVRFLGYLGGRRDTFVSKRAQEVHDRAREVFSEGGGDARYSDYKKKVPGADPVQYTDVRRLFKEGKMSPYTVEAAL